MISYFSFNNLIIGTVASGYLLKKLGGFAMADLRASIVEKGNADGAVFNNSFWGERVFSIEGEFYASDTDDFELKRSNLIKALSTIRTETPLYIYTKSGLELKSDVYVYKPLIADYKAGDAITGNFRIELISQKPFIEGRIIKTTNIYLWGGGGGYIPMSIPFDMSSGGTVITSITNEGNGEVFPTIKIYGVCTNPVLTNITTGDEFSIADTLSSSSDYIEIDTYNRTIVKNGITNLRDKFSGDWMALVGGANQIKYVASNNDSNTYVNFSYYDAYLGI